MPFDPYTLYILASYGIAFLGLFCLLGGAYVAQRKVLGERS